MTDVDPMTDLTDDELRLRAELARTLVPPPTPASLRLAVDAMAAEHLAAPTGARRSWREALEMGARGFRLAAGAVAVVAVVAVAGLALLMAQRDQGRVGASPAATLPAVMQPALPPAAASPTSLGAGEWVDGMTAWVVAAVGSDRMYVTSDGAQTWAGAHQLPLTFDWGVGMTDAMHAYAGGIQTTGDGRDQLIANLSDDGGATWRETVAIQRSGMWHWGWSGSIHFTDNQRGVVLGTQLDWSGGTEPAATPRPGECLGAATDDAGTTWSPLPDAPCLGLGGVTWMSRALGYATLVSGNLAVSMDGGRSWRTAALPDGLDAAAVRVQALTGTALGGLRLVVTRTGLSATETNPLVVLESSDQGSTWTEAYRSVAIDARRLSNVWPLEAEHWLATARLTDPVPGEAWNAAPATLFESWDGGRSWQAFAPTGAIAAPQRAPGAAGWADRLHGMLPGTPASSETSTLLLTNDGGQTWHEVPF